MEPISARRSSEVKGISDFARTATAGGLRRERTPARGSQIFRKAALITDSKIREILTRLDALPIDRREEMTPKCSSGCAYCCYQWVRCTPLEVFAVSDFILSNWNQEQILALVRHLDDYRAEFETHPPLARFSIPCPLLVENRCTVYDVRPFICRGCNSMDVSKCEEGMKDPGGEVLIPVVAPIVYAAAGVRQGMGFGLIDAGLCPTELVFGFALRTALTEPDGASRYYSGEDVFWKDAAPNEPG